MTRAVIKIKTVENGENLYCNLPADSMDCDDTLLSIYREDHLVGIFNVDEIMCAYISEVKGKE